MPAVVEAVPSACYVILGATHPAILARDGEAYRDGLKARVAALGLGEHVKFVDRFVGRVELGTWLEAADIVATPYPNLDQSTVRHARLRHGSRQGHRLDAVRLRLRDARRRTRQARPAAPRKRSRMRSWSSLAIPSCEARWVAGRTTTPGAWCGGRSAPSTGASSTGPSAGRLRSRSEPPAVLRRPLSEHRDGAPAGAASCGETSMAPRLAASTSPGNARPGDTITGVIAVSDTLQQRLPSARHMGAGTLSPIAPSARGPIRPARPDRTRVV